MRVLLLAYAGRVVQDTSYTQTGRRHGLPRISRAPQMNFTMDWALFGSAFLSATLLPGSSEALLLFRLGEGSAWLPLVVVATAGNLLGSILTYGMGRAGNTAMHRRVLRIDEQDIRRAENWFRRWGRPGLLLAWLPIVGDPLCLVAGLLRVSLLSFILLAGAGKFARYAFLAWLVA